MKDEYPTGKADLMTAFMVRAQTLTSRRGTWAMINLPSWMSLKSFEQLRHDLLRDQRICSMVHLGRGIFGSDFGTVAFVVANAPAAISARGVYRRLFEQHVDVRSVATIESLFLDEGYNRFEVSQSDFKAIPGSPIVYWLSEKMRVAFAEGRPLKQFADAQLGMRTGDNGKYLRQWWEVSNEATVFDAESADEANQPGQRWVSYNKGGLFRKWSGNRDYVVLWENNGYAIKEETLRKYPQLSWDNLGWKISNEASFFRPSVSWSKVSSGAPAFREYDRGFIFDVAGTSFFPKDDANRRAMMGVCNSSTGLGFLQALSPTMNFEVGQIAVIPVVLPGETSGVSEIVNQLVQTASSDWDSDESSWGFTENPLVARSRAD